MIDREKIQMELIKLERRRAIASPDRAAIWIIVGKKIESRAARCRSREKQLLSVFEAALARAELTPV